MYIHKTIVEKEKEIRENDLVFYKYLLEPLWLFLASWNEDVPKIAAKAEMGLKHHNIHPNA